MVFDPVGPLVQPAEVERAEVDVPEPIVDFFEADVLFGQDVTDVDPTRVPADLSPHGASA